MVLGYKHRAPLEHFVAGHQAKTTFRAKPYQVTKLCKSSCVSLWLSFTLPSQSSFHLSRFAVCTLDRFTGIVVIKQILRSHLHVVQLLMLLLGAAFIVLYVTVLSTNRWGLPLNSLGAGMIAATLLSMLHSAFGIDVPSVLEQKLRFNQQLIETGLTALHLHIGDQGIFDRFDRAYAIDMLYNTGKNTCRNYLDRVERALISRGCKVRVLVSDPNNPAWNDESVISALCPGTNIKSEIEDVSNRIKMLVQELQEQRLMAGSIELRTFPSQPTGSIVIVDDNFARFTPYLPYSHSAEVPSFDVVSDKGGQLFRAYRNTFERVWARATPLIAVNFAVPDSARLVETSKTSRQALQS